MEILERRTNEIMSIEDAPKTDNSIKATLDCIEYFPFEIVEHNDRRPSSVYYDLDASDDLDYPNGSYGYSDYYYRKRREHSEFYEDSDMLYEE